MDPAVLWAVIVILEAIVKPRQETGMQVAQADKEISE